MWLEPTPTELPPLRVVVPARNEAEHIEACIEALIQLGGHQTTISIMDDDSSDTTLAISRRMAVGHPRVQVRSVPPRPDGWAGKSWAVWNGQPGAEAWLLFVDADVRLRPDLASTLIAEAERHELALLSAFGTWELPTPGTRWLVPAFGWLIRGLVDRRQVEDGRMAFANGQVMLVRRSAYEACGGHESIRASVLDDVHLARAVQRSGGRVSVRWAPWGFRVLPYASASQVVRGYRKNMAAGLDGRRGLAIFGVVAIVWLYLAPLCLGALGVWLAEPILAVAGLVGVALVVGMRLRTDHADGRLTWLAWLHPIAGAVLAYTLWRSMFGGPAAWKGRRFVDGVASPEADST
ncbi:MAG: glycosyltransferase family 2 protein [Myxococcota bacterium]